MIENNGPLNLPFRKGEDGLIEWQKPIPLEIFKEVCGMVKSFRKNFEKGALLIYLMFDTTTEEFYLSIPMQSCQSLTVRRINYTVCRMLGSIACGCFVTPFDASMYDDIWMPAGVQIMLHAADSGVLIQKVKLNGEAINLSDVTSTSDLAKVRIQYGEAPSFEEILRHRGSARNRFGRWMFHRFGTNIGSKIISFFSKKLGTVEKNVGYYLPLCEVEPEIDWDCVYSYAGVSGMFIGLPVHTVIEFKPATLTILDEVKVIV